MCRSSTAMSARSASTTTTRSSPSRPLRADLPRPSRVPVPGQGRRPPRRAAPAHGMDPAAISVLDVGAGNGIVGEELRALGSAARRRRHPPGGRRGGRRDRPGVYDDYLASTDRAHGRRASPPRRRAPNCLTTVAALGFDDMPPEALDGGLRHRRRRRLDRVRHQGRLPRRRLPTGFRRLIADLVHSERARGLRPRAVIATGCRCTATAGLRRRRGRKRRTVAPLPPRAVQRPIGLQTSHMARCARRP